MMAGASRSSLPQACGLRPSADLAGTSVDISIDVPMVFDVPLAPHHVSIGRWVAAQEDAPAIYTRHEARRQIERQFNAAVLEILSGIDIADLRVVVLIGDNGNPPALALICDSLGQIDMGWIEKTSVLSNTIFGNVAPVGWRAAAYAALIETLGYALPVMSYDDLFEEVSVYYWDGETTDEAARQHLAQWHGHDPDDIDAMTMPSEMNARRPDYMLAANADALKYLPRGLATKIRALRAAHKALTELDRPSSAWTFEWEQISDYMPGYQDSSHLPPITLVPFDQFARELDDVCRIGMETSFMDFAGLCLLTDAATIDAWFSSLRIGADFLRAAQALIDFDPQNPRG